MKYLLAIITPFVLSMPIYAHNWYRHNEWLTLHEDNGVQLGAYNLLHRYYRPLDAGEWGDSVDAPPVPLPPEYQSANFGIDNAHLTREVFSYCGRTVTRSELVQQLQQLTDDSQSLRLTIIGADEGGRSRIRQEIETQLRTQNLVNVLIQDYPPDHWSLRPGFVVNGTPTIYLQAPDGRVLHRQDNYEGGAEAVVGAVRRADPNYQPNTDPNLNLTTEAVTGGSVLAIIAGVFLLLLSRREEN